MTDALDKCINAEVIVCQIFNCNLPVKRTVISLSSATVNSEANIAKMYFSLTIVLLAVAVEQAFAESQSPFAQQPQHYSVVQTDSKFPKDLQLQYPTQQTFNEIDSNSPTNQKVNNNVQVNTLM